MRALIAATVLLATAGWGVDQPRRHYWNPEDHGLTAEQVSHYAIAYMPNVRACYVRYAGDAPGKIVVRATVLRTGWLIGVTIEAPGVAGKRFRQLQACVRKEADTWRFPVARDDTDVAMPYHFQRTFAQFR